MIDVVFDPNDNNGVQARRPVVVEFTTRSDLPPLRTRTVSSASVWAEWYFVHLPACGAVLVTEFSTVAVPSSPPSSPRYTSAVANGAQTIIPSANTRPAHTIITDRFVFMILSC